MHSCLLAGDLLTALLLAWLHKHPGNLKLAVELAIAGLQAVLGRTIEAAGDAVTATELSSEVCCCVLHEICTGLALRHRPMFVCPLAVMSFSSNSRVVLGGAGVQACKKAGLGTCLLISFTPTLLTTKPSVVMQQERSLSANRSF